MQNRRSCHYYRRESEGEICHSYRRANLGRGTKNEAQKLADCYKNALQLAADHDCKTIAFPGISTGSYGYPPKEAAKVAVSAITEFIFHSDKIDKVTFVCFDNDNYYFIKSQLNFKVYTVPSTLFAGHEIIGTVNIGLEDDAKGVLSGQLIPNDKYNKYRDFFRDTFTKDLDDHLSRISDFTKDNKFKVVADDGTEFKGPAAGLIIYDLDQEPIHVELNGINSEVWENYYK